MVRVVKRVALARVVYVVLLITALTIAAGIDGVRPGRGASFNRPSTPPQQKSPSPQRSHTRVDLQFFADLLVLFTLSGQQHNAATRRYPHGHSAPTRLPLQLTPTLRVQKRLAWLRA
jgi:hypothetical protein